MDEYMKIPSTLRELLAQLNYFGMIERGQKPCIQTMDFVDANSWVGTISRWISRENSDHLVDEIDKTIDKAIDAMRQYSGTGLIPIIVESLRKAENGLQNLLYTYDRKPKAKARLLVSIATIACQLNQYDTVNTPLPPSPKTEDV